VGEGGGGGKKEPCMLEERSESVRIPKLGSLERKYANKNPKKKPGQSNR